MMSYSYDGTATQRAIISGPRGEVMDSNTYNCTSIGSKYGKLINCENVTAIDTDLTLENEKDKIYIRNIDITNIVQENISYKKRIEELENKMKEMQEMLDAIYFAPGGVHHQSIQWKRENNIYEKEIKKHD